MSGGLLTRGEETRYYLIKKNNPTTVQSTPARTEGDTRRPTVSFFFWGGGGGGTADACAAVPHQALLEGGGGMCGCPTPPIFLRVIRMCYINGLIMNLLPGMFSSGSARLTQNSHHFLFYEYISILHGMLKGKENAEQMYA